MASSTTTDTTCSRLEHILKCIKLVFYEVHKNFSKIDGRSFEDFFSQEFGGKTYPKRMFEDWYFDPERQTEIESKQLFKMLKYIDKLAPADDDVWKGHNKDSIESMICFVNDEREILSSEGMTSANLSKRLDDVQCCLVEILDKVEKKLVENQKKFVENQKKSVENQKKSVENQKNIDLLRNLKDKVRKEFHLSLPTAASLSTASPFVLKISAQHTVHRVFAMVFIHLSELNGATVEDYYREKFNVRKPMCAFTPTEKKMLEENISPEDMTVGLLFKLLERVCGLKRNTDPIWTKESDSLEYLLTCIKKMHRDIPTVNLDRDRSQKLLQLFEKVLDAVSKIKGIDKKEIMQEMPNEPIYLAHACNILNESQSSSDISSSICSSESSSASDSSGSSVLPSIASSSKDECNIRGLYYALCSGGPVAQALALVFHGLQGDISKVPSKKKSGLTPTEMDKVKNEKLENLDITLLYKLIQICCQGLAPRGGPVWQTKADTLEYRLFMLKSERNELSHERIVLSEKELEKKMKLLKHLIKCILEEIFQNNASDDINEKIKEIERELERLSKNPTDIDSYYEQVAKIKEQLEEDTLYKCRKELVEKYNEDSFKYASPITWKKDNKHFTIEKVFIEPEIDYSRSDLRKKSVLSLLDLGKYSQNKVILYGVAGIGKTSISKYLTYKWANSTNATYADLLIFIDCKTTQHSCLLEFLYAYLPKGFRNVSREDIIFIMQDLKLLFIVDSYGDASDNAKKLVDNLLETLPRSAVIITTKEHKVSELEMKFFTFTSSDCMFLKIIGFMKDKQEQYMKNYFQFVSTGNEMKAFGEDMQKFFDSLGKRHREFASLPLTLSLLAKLWEYDSGDAMEATSLSTLYRKIIKYTLTRFTTDADLISKYTLTLGEIAWKNLKNNTTYLKRSDENKLKKFEENGELKLTALLQSTSDYYSLDIKKYWSFFHNSQQEYLAAEHLVDEIINNDKLLSHYEASPQVIEFVVGLLHLEEELTDALTDDIIGLISNQTSFECIRRLYHDVQYPYFREAIQKLFQNEDLKALENFDPECMQWIIENTAIRVPSEVKLTNSACSVMKMGPLLETLDKKKCRPQVIATIDSMHDINDLLKFIEKSQYDFEFTLHVQNAVDLHKVICCWDWQRPIHLLFPKAIFPLLWWELKVSLVAVGISCTSITFSENVSHCDDYKNGIEHLGLPWTPNSEQDTYKIVIEA